jgi:hypothetical protein
VVLVLEEASGDAAANFLNTKDEKGWAPMHSALLGEHRQRRNARIINMLLERGTRPGRWFGQIGTWRVGVS